MLGEVGVWLHLCGGWQSRRNKWAVITSGPSDHSLVSVPTFIFMQLAKSVVHQKVDYPDKQ